MKKKPYAAEETVSSYNFIAKTGLCYGFLGYFGLYLEEIRFMVTSLQSREEHGSEN